MGTGGFLTLGHRRFCDSVLYAHSKLHNDYKLNAFINPFALLFRACAILDCFAYFVFTPLATALHCVHLLATLPCADTVNTGFAFFRKSPRPISISRLKMLPLLHL